MVALTAESASATSTNRSTRRRSAAGNSSTEQTNTRRKVVKPVAEELDLMDDDMDEDELCDEDSRERRRLDRRRQIDPTTCERDYSNAEVEFMKAMDDYKRKSGRPFPTWSEVLEVVFSLGYRQVEGQSEMEWKTYGDALRQA